MSKLDIFLSRLEGVKSRGEGRYIAKCSAHADRSPSLSVAERDGKILVKCFAGCDVSSIVAAVGLNLSDLMPDNPEYSRGYSLAKAHGYKHEFFEKLLYESSILALGLTDILNCHELSDVDLNRCLQSIETIENIRKAYGGK